MPNISELVRKEEERAEDNAQFRRHMEEAKRVNKNPPVACNRTIATKKEERCEFFDMS